VLGGYLIRLMSWAHASDLAHLLVGLTLGAAAVAVVLQAPHRSTSVSAPDPPEPRSQGSLVSSDPDSLRKGSTERHTRVDFGLEGHVEHCVVCGGPAFKDGRSCIGWTCAACGARFLADPVQPWPTVVLRPEMAGRPMVRLPSYVSASATRLKVSAPELNENLNSDPGLKVRPEPDPTNRTSRRERSRH
jgi:hypothetical protein